MHCGWDPHALLKEADVVLVVDCDVPWIPKEGAAEGRRQGHPYRPRSALRALSAARLPHRHRAHRRRRADARGAVARAQKQAPSRRRQIEERRKAVTESPTDVRSKARGGVEPMPATITGKWLSACINKLLDERHDPRQRVPDGAGGNDDRAAGALLRQRRPPAAWAGAWARRSARSSRRRTRP